MPAMPEQDSQSAIALLNKVGEAGRRIREKLGQAPSGGQSVGADLPAGPADATPLPEPAAPMPSGDALAARQALDADAQDAKVDALSARPQPGTIDDAPPEAMRLMSMVMIRGGTPSDLIMVLRRAGFVIARQAPSRLA